MIDTKLITFLTLLEEKNYSKTAARLYITQPAVTHHIKSLEKEYDISLFKNSKTFELTKAGSMLLEYAKSLKLQEEFLLANMKKQDSFICNLGFTPMVKAMIPPIEFLKQIFYETPSFNAYTYTSQELFEHLNSGKIDFAFIDNSFDSSCFESIQVTNEKVVLVGDPKGQYGSKDRITREQLSVATLIWPNEDSGLYKCIQNALKSKNIKLKNNYSVTSNDPDLIRRLVPLTDGLAFMYYDTVKEDIDAGRLKKFDILNLQITQNIYVIYPKSLALDDNQKKLLEIVSKSSRWSYGSNSLWG